MNTQHTPGPWEIHAPNPSIGFQIIWRNVVIAAIPCIFSEPWAKPNARLIAAAPDLLEALKGSVELSWFEDSHRVSFDKSVMFGPSYDFSGIDGYLRQEFIGEVECIVWPSGGVGRRKWSAYCTHEGSLWFERFDTADEAKEVCMCLLDRVLPSHPAMKSRAAIAKATSQ
jgi:hypothetical protein